MGTIYYGGSAFAVHIEGRTLAHVHVVVTTKLRRGESFTLSWPHRDDEPPGRSTIWLHPGIPLRFEFEDSDGTELSRQYLEDLAYSASTPGGNQLTKEDVGPCRCALALGASEVLVR